MMTDDSCGLPSQHARGLFTRLNRHHLVGQHRKVVIDCARSGIQVLFIGRVNRQWCAKS
jgi:hypothetical protein